MLTVKFMLSDGSEKIVESAEGNSVMQAASENGVPGVDAVCGGHCSCATCHVYVDENWLSALPAPSQDELDLLSGAAAEQLASSRLSCQIKLTSALNGLTVTVPEFQV
jgi:2Fe-2S ferredoxin